VKNLKRSQNDKNTTFSFSSTSLVFQIQYFMKESLWIAAIGFHGADAFLAV